MNLFCEKCIYKIVMLKHFFFIYIVFGVKIHLPANLDIMFGFKHTVSKIAEIFFKLLLLRIHK